MLSTEEICWSLYYSWQHQTRYNGSIDSHRLSSRSTIRNYSKCQTKFGNASGKRSEDWARSTILEVAFPSEIFGLTWLELMERQADHTRRSGQSLLAWQRLKGSRSSDFFVIKLVVLVSRVWFDPILLFSGTRIETVGVAQVMELDQLTYAFDVVLNIESVSDLLVCALHFEDNYGLLVVDDQCGRSFTCFRSIRFCRDNSSARPASVFGALHKTHPWDRSMGSWPNSHRANIYSPSEVSRGDVCPRDGSNRQPLLVSKAERPWKKGCEAYLLQSVSREAKDVGFWPQSTI